MDLSNLKQTLRERLSSVQDVRITHRQRFPMEAVRQLALGVILCQSGWTETRRPLHIWEPRALHGLVRRHLLKQSIFLLISAMVHIRTPGR